MINFAWLLKLRWVSVGGQALTVLVAQLAALTHPLPLAPLGALIIVQAVSNAAGYWVLRRRQRMGPLLLAAPLVFDVLCVSAELLLTGGASNPLSVVLLVYLALAVIILPRAMAWLIAVLAVAGFGALFPGHDMHSAHNMQRHLQGMWAAFALTAVGIVYFVGRVNGALRDREAELAQTQAFAAQAERMAALATLAAGAAHELSTPLSTIAVISKELEHTLVAHHDDAELLEDARLIRSQVDRCRQILDRLATEAGRSRGETPLLLHIKDVLEAVIRGLGITVPFDIAAPLERRQLRLFPNALREALTPIIDNARQSAGEAGVRVSASLRGERLAIQVIDTGPGMSPDVLAKATEPFFTTKPAGTGMGLGLFLARAVIERMGGSLSIETSPGEGCCVTVLLGIPNDE